jgi:uncharacterized membrane protein
MMTINDPIALAYLSRLRAATADLPPDEREELVSSIAEHIATSLAEADEPGEAAVRTILDRLGDPATIAAEARGQLVGQRRPFAPMPYPPVVTGAPPAPADRPGALEWTGVIVLGLGSYVLPIVGTVVGLVLICMSKWWTTGQKALAVGLSLLGAIVIPLLLGALFLASEEGTPVRAPIEIGVPAVPEPTR